MMGEITKEVWSFWETLENDVRVTIPCHIKNILR